MIGANMALPLDDPQFWIVSMIAAIGLAALIRRLTPGASRTKRSRRRVRLTVRGKDPH